MEATRKVSCPTMVDYSIYARTLCFVNSFRFYAQNLLHKISDKIELYNSLVEEMF